MLFRPLILVIQLKKADYNTKIDKIYKKIPDQDKYITPEINKLTAKKFVARLKQAKLATKDDIDDIVTKTDVD